MIKSFPKLIVLSLLAIAVAGIPAPLQAQTMTKPATEKENRPRKPAVTPFHGKLKAIDKTAKTISLGELTIQITSETKIDRNDKPAVLEDGVVGENVSGAYKKSEDGKLTATLVHFGVKSGSKSKSAKTDPKKEM